MHTVLLEVGLSSRIGFIDFGGSLVAFLTKKIKLNMKNWKISNKRENQLKIPQNPVLLNSDEQQQLKGGASPWLEED